MNIFIIGGTSGIGLALAQIYLEKGFNVCVCGRNVSKIPNEKLSKLKSFQLDVYQKDQLFSAVQSFIDGGNLDIFINCAGSYAEDVAGKISYFEAEEMLKTNISGTVHFFETGREIMKNQESGKMATIASVSGILNYENSSLYTKTKRAVIQISEAYHRALQPFGISVTIVAPGYIDTQKLRNLNHQNLKKKPFLMDEKTAAITIFNAIESNKKIIIFPQKMKWMMKSLSIFPSFLLNLIMFRKAKWMKNE